MKSGILAEIVDKANIRLVRYGHGKHPRGTHVKFFFPDFDLWYILSGALMLDINGKKYRVKPGDAFLMTPDSTFEYEALEYTELLFCHFTFSYGGGPNLRGDFADYKIPPVHQDLLKVFSHYFFGLSSDDLTSKIAVKSVLRILLAEMIQANFENFNAYLVNAGSKNMKRFSVVFKYIHENISTNITNKKLSSLAGYNESYFSRCFKEQTGMSPKKYILKTKMDFACNLLMEQGLTVKETADRVGFSDQFVFSKIFKSFYGISPSSFKGINA